ncbi:MAG: NAD+ synthase [Thermoplasmata archaeon]
MTGQTLKDDAEKVIELFLAERLMKAGASGYVLGVSGGIDSAVVLRLAARAVGNEHVLGLIMPEKESPDEDLRDAEELCRSEGIRYEVLDISDPVEAFKGVVGGRPDKKALANIKARCRMTVLYHFAATQSRLVLGTSNKSEMLVGYFTKYGDGGADLEPIGDLYKTEVRQLAGVLGIPEKIVRKAPSAGLWKGQTDEGEMGITYDMLDVILQGIEQGLSDREVAEKTGASTGEVERIREMIRRSSHKRKFPPVAKMGLRTPGLDWPEGDEQS